MHAEKKRNGGRGGGLKAACEFRTESREGKQKVSPTNEHASRSLARAHGSYTLAWSPTELHLAGDAERCKDSDRCEPACESRSRRDGGKNNGR